MKEITVEQLHNLPLDSYELIDIRDDGLVEYCTCGCKVDRDYNEELNIKTEGLKMIAA